MPEYLSNVVNYLKSETDPQIRFRGQSYFLQHRVHVTTAFPTYVIGYVEGSRGAIYDFVLEEDPSYPNGVHVECNCPHFQAGELCKHLYAAALEVESRRDELQAQVSREQEQVATELESAELVTRRERPDWRLLLDATDDLPSSSTERALPPIDRSAQIYFLLNTQELDDPQMPRYIVETAIVNQSRQRPARWERVQLGTGDLQSPNASWVEVISSLMALDHVSQFGPGHRLGRYESSGLEIPPEAIDHILPRLLDTGRLVLWDGSTAIDESIQLVHNALHEIWEYVLELEQDSDGFELRSFLQFEDQLADGEEVLASIHSRFLVWSDRITRLRTTVHKEWMWNTRNRLPIRIDAAQVDDFLGSWYKQDAPPPLRLPVGIGYREESQHCTPGVECPEAGLVHDRLRIHPYFDYGRVRFSEHDERTQVAFPDSQTLVRRDVVSETAHLEELQDLGFVPPTALYPFWTLARDQMAESLTALADRGWNVRVGKHTLAADAQFQMAVSSGTDWFDLEGGVRVDGLTIGLPTLLQHRQSGSPLVRLPGGTVALLPEEWERRLDQLAQFGEVNGEALRFKGARSLFLDLLLEQRDDVEWLGQSAPLRQKLRELQTPKSSAPCQGFQGTLRGYQEEGLGWLRYLRELGIGGCLADDMGLGKTVQVLALLEEQRSQSRGQSIVVLPKSLIFNWQLEAERFTPELRVLPHAGSQRCDTAKGFEGFDLILVSYHTLIRDISWIKDIDFDYAILDEAQAIKNADTATSKAARLLQAKHRLSMTGTPIENRLDDLWSQINFLNPGLLRASILSRQATDPATRDALAKCIRPFLLRRTKEQVATDLPPKVEETLYCELPTPQRKAYDELKAYYQGALGDQIERDGLNRSKIIVLEALLRLRQAACHPALLDQSHARMESGKLSALQDLLSDIVPSGHKVLIFSQFTSFLAIVRKLMERLGVQYEYLDGQTADRQRPVQRFQNDPKCAAFLVSLKAGGVGLNLTAADYVVLLDPWWNPAVEAQAIDRTHRIGQTKRVFAYRIVAKDTIEDKILSLQKNKRDLADAIVGERNSLLAGLTEDDLQFLLS